MERGGVLVVALMCGTLAIGCCANRHGDSTGEPYGTKGNQQVQAVVTADFKVEPDPLHLSLAAGQQAVWTLREGKGRLGVEPKREWPLKVSCRSGRCVGRLISGAKPGSYPYRVVIGGKPGPDPMIIIDP